MLLDHLPPLLVQNLSVFGLIVVGFLVEKRYVSRPSIFANAIAINVHVNQKTLPPEWLVWYANIAFIAGMIAICFYAVDESLPSEFYGLALLTYSSLPVAGVVIISSLYV
ncbi:hypothetical protein [Salinarchaeum sp. Harcht-Bsk1]|uniref:hypothetical protein n=1 Tax=Salinarchaeum sp. Harcht-Bsk1 TaxID=1333523 RepID=UPI000677E5E2|nr:hypothetical protein [Salinarchaeum sp. Harcht-Bsk1]